MSYLLKNGSEKVITSTREHIYDLKSLETFTYHDEQNKDQGINSMFSLRIVAAIFVVLVRHKVKEVLEFVQDDNRLRDERKKARANRDKYIGLSNETSSRNSEDQYTRPRHRR